MKKITKKIKMSTLNLFYECIIKDPLYYRDVLNPLEHIDIYYREIKYAIENGYSCYIKGDYEKGFKLYIDGNLVER